MPPFIGPHMPAVGRHKRKDFLEARSDEAGNIDYIGEEEDLGPGGVVKKESKSSLEHDLEIKKRILDIKMGDLDMKMRDLEMRKRKAGVEGSLESLMEAHDTPPGSEVGLQSTPLHLVLSKNSTQMLKQKAAMEIKSSTPALLTNKAAGRTAPTPFPTHEMPKKAYTNVQRTSMRPLFKNDIAANSTLAPPPVTTNIPTADLLAAIWAAATSTTTTTTTTTPATTQTTATTSRKTSTSAIRTQVTTTIAPSLVNHFLALKSVSPTPVSVVSHHHLTTQSTSAKLSPSPVSSMDVYKSALRPVMETNLEDLGSVNLAARQESESEGRKSARVSAEEKLLPMPETSQKRSPAADLGHVLPGASQSTVPAQLAAATWRTKNPSRQNPARGIFDQKDPTGSIHERQNHPSSETYNAQSPSSSSYKGDLEQVPSSRHQVILLGPHSLPETLDSLEKVLSNGPNSIEGREVGLDKVGAIAKPVEPSQSSAIPSKEEILSIIGISKQPTSIKKTLSSLDKVSSKKEEKKRLLAAIKERAKQSNINYNKPKKAKSPKDENGAKSFQTIYNPVTGRPLGLVSSGDGSFFPVSLGVSPRPFHPRENNLMAATTDEFHVLKQVRKSVICQHDFKCFQGGMGEAW